MRSACLWQLAFNVLFAGWSAWASGRRPGDWDRRCYNRRKHKRHTQFHRHAPGDRGGESGCEGAHTQNVCFLTLYSPQYVAPCVPTMTRLRRTGHSHEFGHTRQFPVRRNLTLPPCVYARRPPCSRRSRRRRQPRGCTHAKRVLSYSPQYVAPSVSTRRQRCMTRLRRTGRPHGFGHTRQFPVRRNLTLPPCVYARRPQCSRWSRRTRQPPLLHTWRLCVMFFFNVSFSLVYNCRIATLSSIHQTDASEALRIYHRAKERANKHNCDASFIKYITYDASLEN